MLSKLMKYDLKWTIKVVIVFYTLAFIFSVISRLFGLIDNSLLFTILKEVTSGFAIGMMVSCLINGIMRSWARFVNNIYKDESYLTHTLPIKKETIYLAKVLSAIITAFITVLVIIGCLFICFYSKESIAYIKSSLELAASTYDTSVINIILIMAFVAFLEIVFIILSGFVGIIIGHRANDNKMVKSIITGFIIYIGTSLFTLLMVFLVGLFNTDVMNVINTTNIININAIKIIMIIGILVYLVYNILYYYVGKNIFKKGVNVD